MKGLRNRISSRLIEFDFVEPTNTRIDYLLYTVALETHNIDISLVTDNEIDIVMMDLFNFIRYRNTRLAIKMTDDKDIIRKTDKWLYVKKG